MCRLVPPKMGQNKEGTSSIEKQHHENIINLQVGKANSASKSRWLVLVWFGLGCSGGLSAVAEVLRLSFLSRPRSFNHHSEKRQVKVLPITQCVGMTHEVSPTREHQDHIGVLVQMPVPISKSNDNRKRQSSLRQGMERAPEFARLGLKPNRRRRWFKMRGRRRFRYIMYRSWILCHLKHADVASTS